MMETNIQWNQSIRGSISPHLLAILATPVLRASNISTKREEDYQPDISILTVVGPQGGRMINIVSDIRSYITWTEMRGGETRRLLINSAYRVSKKEGAVDGPNTS